MNAPRFVCVVVPDMFFMSKIQTAASHLGIGVGQTTPANLVADCRARRPDLVIVDLHGADGLLDAVRAFKRDPALVTVRVIGFYSHVEDATRRAALEAGVDDAMPRSAFTLRLPALLAGAG